MAAAIAALSENAAIDVEAVSGLFRTPPWGRTDQPAFLNAAVRIETRLAPRELLQTILAAERRLGRERTERWGPRNIDIDILVYGEETIDEPGLHIPHPRLHERAFALAPLAEVLPDHLIAGKTAAAWLAEVDTSGMTRIAGPGWHRSSASA